MSTAEKMDTTENAENTYSYDVVPYPSHPFRQTHPERLATVGRLFGIEPADINNCRILEIGCAGGGNLIPMADALPDSTFVGVDLSEFQIDGGQKSIEKMGLKNIELKHLNCMDIDEEFGKFDYIIAHGVFSWVAEEVQEKIFSICNENLEENGVAFVSYNTYPGWHMRGMIRDMMQYHVRNFTDPKKRIQQARAILEFLAKSVSKNKDAYSLMLNSELEMLRKQTDNYLFHEHLETNNEPVFFHEFISRAGKHDLQYLGESVLANMWLGNFPKEIAETLERVAPDIIQREQYADFVRNRTFRQTLLCHKTSKVDRALKLESLDGAHLIGNLQKNEEEGQEPRTDGKITYVNPASRQTMTTADPLVQIAIEKITEAWPKAMAFSEIVEAVQEKVFAGDALAEALKIDQMKRSLATNVIHMTVSGIIDLQFCESRYTLEFSEKPKTSEVARYQAALTNRLTNARHESVAVDDLTRHLTPFIDGTRTVEELGEKLKELVDNGKLVIQRKGDKNAEIDVSQVMNQAVNEVLKRLSASALLIE